MCMIKGNRFLARAAIPGMKIEDVTVFLNPGEKIIKVSSPGFHYSFKHNHDIDESTLIATYYNGIVEIEADIHEKTLVQIDLIDADYHRL